MTRNRSSNRISKTTIALFASALLVTSCSIPPKEAWQNFKTKVASVFKSHRDVKSKNMPVPDRSQLAVSRYQSIDRRMKIASDTALANSPRAVAIPGRPGYVRSPFTTPGRLVDVREFETGTLVRCPYTKNVFVVPSPSDVTSPPPIENLVKNRTVFPRHPAADLRPQPGSSLASLNKKPRVIEPSSTPTLVPDLTPERKPEPKIAKSNPVKPPTSSPTRPDNLAANGPKRTPPPSNLSSSGPDKLPTTPTSATGSSEKPPFGSPVAGRPGFVNSPFAAKHQLVDVSGLPDGTEVKCPYSGKLFRVPSRAASPPPSPSNGGKEKGGDEPASTPKKTEDKADPPAPSDKPKGSGTDTSARTVSPAIGRTPVAALDSAKLTGKTTAAKVAPTEGSEAAGPSPEPAPTADRAPANDGFVISPHAAGKLIDIRGKSAGTQMRCPFTGKFFTVPK